MHHMFITKDMVVKMLEWIYIYHFSINSSHRTPQAQKVSPITFAQLSHGSRTTSLSRFTSLPPLLRPLLSLHIISSTAKTLSPPPPPPTTTITTSNNHTLPLRLRGNFLFRQPIYFISVIFSSSQHV